MDFWIFVYLDNVFQTIYMIPQKFSPLGFTPLVNASYSFTEAAVVGSISSKLCVIIEISSY